MARRHSRKGSYKHIRGKRVKRKVEGYYKRKKHVVRPKSSSKYIAGAVAYKIQQKRAGKKVKFNFKGKNRTRRKSR